LLETGPKRTPRRSIFDEIPARPTDMGVGDRELKIVHPIHVTKAKHLLKARPYRELTRDASTQSMGGILSGTCVTAVAGTCSPPTVLLGLHVMNYPIRPNL
jgi:hypothetical protein